MWYQQVRGETPLFAAIQAEADMQVILLLLRHGACVNPAEIEGAATENPAALRVLERVRVMLAIFEGRLPRTRKRNTLRVIPDELLRKLNDML